MLAFKSGVRPGTIMPAIAQSLTEKEIEDLSLYMSKMKCAP
jgi:cytochrome c553